MKTKRGEAIVQLENVSMKRKGEFLSASLASKRFHGKWISAPSNETEFADYLKRARRKTSKSFFLCRISDKKLVGVINISQIVRGFFQSAFLGYYIFKPFAKNGYMTEGLSLALSEAFSELGLHRLEANIQPTNLPSRKMVKRLGFRLEGYSPGYLKVNEKWRDHERWAITFENWKNRNGIPRTTKQNRIH